MPTPEQNAYVLNVCGVDPAAYPQGTNGSPTSAPVASPPAAVNVSGSVSGTLPATSTAVFFDIGSPTLTPADTAVLDTLAAAWLAAANPDAIAIEGFASLDGDPAFNKTLAKQRADAVVAYLIGKGIPKDKVSGDGKGPTSQFDEKDPRQNRRAKLPLPPAPPPKMRSIDDLYAQGHQDGLDGRNMVCPVDANADGEKAYNQGYAVGLVDRQKASLISRIEGDLKVGQDLKKEIDDLRTLDMDGILDVLEVLKKDGQLDNFSNVSNLPDRIGTAILTTKPDLDEQWQALVAKLAPPEREAVLKRVPQGSYHGSDPVPPTPPSAPPDVGPQGVVQLGGQYAGHLLLKNLKPNDPSNDKTLQLQIGLNDVRHPKDQGGLEVQVFAQFGYNVAKKQPTTPITPKAAPVTATTDSAVIGAQAALVQAVSALVQTQEFLQMTYGVAYTGGQAQSQLQASIGAQGAVQLNGNWSIGLQAAVNVTDQHGSPGDLALAGTLFVQFTF
jgi:outer membrane protein OmpA-like peptidoglycan-associated protein